MAEGKKRLTRRRVLLSGLAAGGGLAVAAVWALQPVDDGDATQKFGASTPDAVPLNAWIKIAPDGTITCGVHRAEMGQGVATALPMMIAEEMDADWAQVRYEFTPVDKDYFNFGILFRGAPFGDPDGSVLASWGTSAARMLFSRVGATMTVGSTSVIDAYDTLRPAGAAAKAMLVAAAADAWGVRPSTLRTEKGFVIDDANDRRASYGALAEAAARQTPPSDPPLKAPEDYTIVGTNAPRLDIGEKVDGSGVFAIDVTQPDMLYATLRQSPVFGATIADLDDSKARAMPGVVEVVRVNDFTVAVVAERTWQAMQAAKALDISYDPPPRELTDSATLFGRMRAKLDDPMTEPSVFREADDLDAGFESAATIVEAEYTVPYLAHLCMEPMSCAALVTESSVEIWAPTQAASLAHDIGAERTGVPPENVRVHTTLLGGGFGRRADQDYVVQAVEIAKAVPGRPVRLVWTREEDVQHDTYRPAALNRNRGAVAADGSIVAWDSLHTGQSVVHSFSQRSGGSRGNDPTQDRESLTGITDMPYGLSNLQAAYVPWISDVPCGYWRSVSNSYAGFFVESFMDEMAHAAGLDPVDFRRRHLAHSPVHLAVVDEAARLGNWGAPMGPGRGRGFALSESHGSIAAQVIEVTVQDGDQIKVDRVVCVLDCRQVIRPDTVIAQMEGSIIMGLSAALIGNITLTGGRVDQRNFNDARMMALAECPEIEVKLLPQGGRPGGVGEPGLPPVAAALANAVFDATGQRFRSLPLSQHGFVSV